MYYDKQESVQLGFQSVVVSQSDSKPCHSLHVLNSPSPRSCRSSAALNGVCQPWFTFCHELPVHLPAMANTLLKLQTWCCPCRRRGIKVSINFNINIELGSGSVISLIDPGSLTVSCSNNTMHITSVKLRNQKGLNLSERFRCSAHYYCKCINLWTPVSNVNMEISTKNVYSYSKHANKVWLQVKLRSLLDGFFRLDHRL